LSGHKQQQESRAVARNPRDAACYHFDSSSACTVQPVYIVYMTSTYFSAYFRDNFYIGPDIQLIHIHTRSVF